MIDSGDSGVMFELVREPCQVLCSVEMTGLYLREVEE